MVVLVGVGCFAVGCDFLRRVSSRVFLVLCSGCFARLPFSRLGRPRTGRPRGARTRASQAQVIIFGSVHFGSRYPLSCCSHAGVLLFFDDGSSTLTPIRICGVYGINPVRFNTYSGTENCTQLLHMPILKIGDRLIPIYGTYSDAKHGVVLF